jgi:hypothetical protein
LDLPTKTAKHLPSASTEPVFKVLSTRGEDAAEWRRYLLQFKDQDRDIFFSVDYACAYERGHGCDAFLAAYVESGGLILMPFALRDVRQLAFIERARVGGSVYDMTSLYPFGGPIAHCGSGQLREQLHRNFQKHLASYCAGRGIVAQFIAFHPLLENHKAPQATGLLDIERRKEVVWIDLEKSEEALIGDMSSGHRRGISLARRRGVVVEHCRPEATNLAQFAAHYRQMLGRVGAHDRWNFSDKYFEQCAECLGHDHVSLFNARRHSETITSALILHDKETVHYHLSSGSHAHTRQYHANHLLIFELALWAKARGCRRLVLGGGARVRDGVFRFKALFSKSRAWLYTTNVVHDRRLYGQLCQAHAAWNAARGLPARSDDFFPAYRG